MGYTWRYGGRRGTPRSARDRQAHPGAARRAGGHVPGDYLRLRERNEAAVGGDPQPAPCGRGRAADRDRRGAGRARTLRGPTQAHRALSRGRARPCGGAARATPGRARVPAAPVAMTLPERIVEIHRALSKAGIPHAFGGAIALAYATLDPRGTSDVDVNIFTPASEPERALAALPEGIDQP